jgi:WD repeat-containing protein 68
MPHGAAAGILQAAQNLASFGAPTGNLENAISGRTTVGTDRLYSSSGNISNSSPEGPPTAYGLPHPNSSATIRTPSAGAAMNQQQQFETPRRIRQDELHLPPSTTNMNSQRGPLSPREYASTGPRISLEQATPEGSQYHNSGQLPGSSALGLSHNYTRSSPAAGFDGQGGYPPFSATTPNTDQGHFTSANNQKYTPAQRQVSNTPLGLADIRPRADSGLADGLPGANPYSYDGANATPTNSNYLAPWAIYAFDWCKWPAQNHDAGKLAVGSYLEDGHNFVSLLHHLDSVIVMFADILILDSNIRFTNYSNPCRVIHTRRPEIWVRIRENS